MGEGHKYRRGNEGMMNNIEEVSVVEKAHAISRDIMLNRHGNNNVALFQCMLWSWYMANDTQFYILGILLLLVSVRLVAMLPAVTPNCHLTLTLHWITASLHR
jgi:hypothetical protein